MWMPVITWKRVAGLAAEGAQGPGHNPALAGRAGSLGTEPWMEVPHIRAPGYTSRGGRDTLTQLLELRCETQKLSINLGE